MSLFNSVLKEYPLVDPKTELRQALMANHPIAVKMILKKHPELANCEYVTEPKHGFTTSPLLLACQRDGKLFNISIDT